MAVAILFSGLIFNYQLNKYEYNLELIYLEQTFYNSVDTLLKDIEKTKISLTHLIAELSVRKSTNLIVHTASLINLETVLSLDRTLLYKSFVLSKKGNLLNKNRLFDRMMKKIYFINSAEKMLEKYFEKLIFEINERNHKFNDKLEIVDTFIINLLLTNRVANDQLLIEFDKILRNFQNSTIGLKAGAHSLIIMNYIEPLFDVCRNNLNDMRAIELMPHLKSVFAINNSINLAIDFYLHNFSKLSNDLKVTTRMIKLYIKKFKNMDYSVI